MNRLVLSGLGGRRFVHQRWRVDFHRRGGPPRVGNHPSCNIEPAVVLPKSCSPAARGHGRPGYPGIRRRVVFLQSVHTIQISVTTACGVKPPANRGNRKIRSGRWHVSPGGPCPGAGIIDFQFSRQVPLGRAWSSSNKAPDDVELTVNGHGLQTCSCRRHIG